jgi:murein DD-endopeptidase MepM/ murein hydrolase activator NlpD
LSPAERGKEKQAEGFPAGTGCGGTGSRAVVKKNRYWTLLVIEPSGTREGRAWRVSAGVVFLLAGVFSGGLLGLARVGWFSTSYALARFGVCQHRRENASLNKKVLFLARFAEQEAEKAARLAEFEDVTRMKYGLNVISADVRMAGVGGRPNVEDMVLESLRDPAVSRADSVKSVVSALLRQIELQRSTFSRMADHVKRRHDQWAQRPSVWPVRGRITSGFGNRVHPLSGYTAFHEGIDIANKSWTPVFATADGIVSFSGWKRHYGNTVVVDHLNGVETRYAHLVQPAVVEGRVVKRYELIGYLGNSGLSTGPHLHYEVREMEKPVNPMGYILPVDTVVD